MCVSGIRLKKLSAEESGALPLMLQPYFELLERNTHTLCLAQLLLKAQRQEGEQFRTLHIYFINILVLSSKLKAQTRVKYPTRFLKVRNSQTIPPSHNRKLTAINRQCLTRSDYYRQFLFKDGKLQSGKSFTAVVNPIIVVQYCSH